MKNQKNIRGRAAASLLLVLFLAACGSSGGNGDYGSSPAPAAQPVTTLDVATLNAGGYYFNVHTANFPNGEIRGQIIVPSGATGTITISTPLRGSEEVPPATTAGTGTGTLTVNTATGDVSSAAITVSGLSGAVSAAHIHQAAAGANGPVVVVVNATTLGGSTGGTTGGTVGDGY